MDADIFNDRRKGEVVENLFLEFLTSFNLDGETSRGTTGVSEEGFNHYEVEARSMLMKELSTLPVDFDHVLQSSNSLQLVVSEEFLRFEPHLRNAVRRLAVNVYEKMKSPEDEERRREILEDINKKDFWIAFYNLPIVKKLRDLSTSEIGKLTSVSGVVTRTSEVRPELLFGSFKCLECGNVIRDVEQQFKYTQPLVCTNATCQNGERWALLRQESKFGDWQRVRMQENSGEIPAGSLPRSLDIILRHEIVEQARAGDKCIFTGSVVVIPDVAALSSPGEKAESRRKGNPTVRNEAATGSEGLRGIKALGARDLSYRLAFLANSLKPMDRKTGIDIRGGGRELVDADPMDSLSEIESEEVQRMKAMPQIYDRLVNSVAPTVFGHQDIKRAILLMLFGGVHKTTHEGIKLRGDINVCIVGDPSCAKSQFLKYVAGFLPRAVYTSGKSSSAAGLTASVVKEPETGEFCIEAGALMLADNGICCIDEFDKMDIKDQVAIHEAMEQQTISITKAGIQATLNARTSILAAANPSGGRYDKSKPLKYNVALPPAILSRFDLVHVMIDEPDELMDHNIATHIVRVHQLQDLAVDPEFTTAQLQRYIASARAIKPELSEEARKVLVDAYVSLRKGDATPGSQVAYRITVRQLEALVRLSEAIARAHLEDKVRPSHVREAKRLLSTSIISVDTHEIDVDDPGDEAAERDDEERGDKEHVPVPGSSSHHESDNGPISVQSAPSTLDATKGLGAERPKDVEEVQAKKMKITYEQFQKVTRALVVHLQQHEDSQEDGTGSAGIRQQDLVNWYVTLLNDQGAFSSLNEMMDEYRQVRAIIQHLIAKEGVLIVLDDGVATAEALEKAAQDVQDQENPPRRPQISVVNERILAVNPNYSLE